MRREIGEGFVREKEQKNVKVKNVKERRVRVRGRLD